MNGPSVTGARAKPFGGPHLHVQCATVPPASTTFGALDSKPSRRRGGHLGRPKFAYDLKPPMGDLP
jgi:hypothetical protein